MLETQSRVAEEKARQEKQRMEEEKEQQASSHRLATQELNNQLDELKLKVCEEYYNVVMISAFSDVIL